MLTLNYVYVQAMASHGCPHDTGLLQLWPSAGPLPTGGLILLQA